MRRNAARVARMVQAETQNMEKRKAYIEEMTAYVNNRIRELNKVKMELGQEMKWIDISNLHIQELAQTESVMKVRGSITLMLQTLITFLKAHELYGSIAD